MLRIEKGLAETNTAKVRSLGENWESFIPKRPDYPADYSAEAHPDDKKKKRMRQEKRKTHPE